MSPAAPSASYTGYSLISAFKSCMHKYATFSGRATGSEYWFFVLVYFLLCFVPVVNFIVPFALFIPALAVCVRRLHDTGRSGWNILFGLIPLVGFIILLVFYCSDSQVGTNQYGPSEKYPD